MGCTRICDWERSCRTGTHASVVSGSVALTRITTACTNVLMGETAKSEMVDGDHRA